MKIENLKGEIWRVYINNYYFSNYGRVKRIGKRKEWIINPYVRTTKKGHKSLYVHVHRKEVRVSVIVYQLFVGYIPEGYRVHHKDNIYTNNDFMNLELLSMKELGQITGGRSSKRRMIYDIDNDCFYKGTREAAIMLHTNRQTISDYCNKKVKKPMFNLKWDE